MSEYYEKSSYQFPRAKGDCFNLHTMMKNYFKNIESKIFEKVEAKNIFA